VGDQSDGRSHRLYRVLLVSSRDWIFLSADFCHVYLGIWMLIEFGNHARFVFCFENGTLFPDYHIFPWKRPSWECLKGVLREASNACVPNMLEEDERESAPSDHPIWGCLHAPERTSHHRPRMHRVLEMG
jgi:hypothetical protein